MIGKNNIPYHTFIRRIKSLSRIRDNHDGFTLIEILVASTIASIILIMVYTSYHSIIKTIQDITGYSEYYENINLAITKIDSDISNAYFNKDNPKIAFIGIVSGDNSTFNFVTVNHRSFNVKGSIKKPVHVSDVNEIGYYLKEDPQIHELFYLMRREQPHYDDDPESGGSESKILENVMGLKIEFKMRNDWTDTWDSRETKRFPEIIRTKIRVKTYTGKEEEFIFLSRVDMSS